MSLMKGKPILPVLLAVLSGLTCLSASHAEEITIAVAANFANTARELAAEFEQRTDHTVQIASGSTGAHYAQIRQGAPFDVFFAADVKTPEQLEMEGATIADSRFTYARGQLVLWSPKPGLIDAEARVLRDGNFRHLAIANPRLAPYGLAAQQTLETLETLALFDGLQNKLVRGENIAQAHQFVHSGAADLGFVALAQVIDREQPGKIAGSYWLVPHKYYSPIEQQAVLLKDKQAARDFLAFVKSDTGKAIIQAYGYEVP